jgi:hypothetical protein
MDQKNSTSIKQAVEHRIMRRRPIEEQSGENNSSHRELTEWASDNSLTNLGHNSSHLDLLSKKSNS